MTILSVTNLYAVVEDTQMIGTHRAYINRLEATHTAVILELHPSEIAHSIGHRVTVQSFELLAGEHLGWYHFLIGATAINNDILDILHRVQPAMTHGCKRRVLFGERATQRSVLCERTQCTHKIQ